MIEDKRIEIRAALGPAEKTLEEALTSYQGHLLQSLLEKTTSKPFDEFIANGDYAPLRTAIEAASAQLGYTRNELIFNFLTDKERNIIGPLFHEYDNIDSKTSNTYGAQRDPTFEKSLLQSKELQDYRRNLQPYLSKEQNERCAEHIATFLWHKLTPEERGSITPQRIKRHILNLGFVRQPRCNHREAYKYMVEYAPLFKTETEVLDCILERYVDEELFAVGTHLTSAQKTKQRIKELKQEVKTLYDKVRHDA